LETNDKHTSAHYFLVEELPENGATIAAQRNSGVKNVKALASPPFPS
jgi:hypothetical protein